MKNKPTEEQEKDRLVELLAHMILDSYFNKELQEGRIDLDSYKDIKKTLEDGDKPQQTK